MEADIKKRPQTIKEFRELLGLFKTSAPQFSNIPAVQLVIPEYDKENIFSSSSRIDLLIEDLNDNDKYEINSKYKIDELIGFGLYNYTFKGTNRSTLSTVLIKRLIFDPSSGCSSGGNWRNLFNSMKSLNHPHIVKTIDFICNQSIFYIMEYCNGGSVKNLMCKLGHPLTLEEAIPIIYQVCDGLEYAHRSGQKHLLSGGRFINGINHFALHPTNILFQDLGVEKIVKISDFGLNEEMLDRMTTYPGGCYSSIDKLGVSVCKGLDQSKFTNDHDIWSVAACLYYFLTGTYPRDVLQGDYPDDCLLHGGRFGWASNGAVDETWSKSPVIPIRNRGVNIPDRLADFIDRVLYLGEDVSKRAAQPLIFCSAIEFKQALKQTFNA